VEIGLFIFTFFFVILGFSPLYLNLPLYKLDLLLDLLDLVLALLDLIDDRVVVLGALLLVSFVLFALNFPILF
jgi:hypothetical protein